MSEVSHTTVSARHSNWWFQFAFTLGLGVLLFLATNSTIAGAVLPSLSAAAKSLQSGMWIWRHDPNRKRGRICAVFYVATASWKGGAAALISVLVFLLVSVFAGRNPNPDQLATVMITLAIGCLLTTLFGLVATIQATRQGLRIWVHPNFPDNNRRDSADSPTRNRAFNHAIFVVGTSLAFPSVLIGIFCLLAAVVVGQNSPWAGALNGIGFIALIVGPLCTIPLYSRLSHRIIATTPNEYWNLKPET